MSETQAPGSYEVDSDLTIDLPIEESSQYALGRYGLEIHAQQAALIKEKVDELGAEISQKQDRIKLLHEILQAINKLADENGLEISKYPELITKLKVAKELGIDIDETKVKFSIQERDFLKESLQISAQDYNEENRLKTQQMQVYIQQADRWLMVATNLVKIDERVNKRMVERQR